ncbi:MAG: autotransporter-associated beta strand repeat-containing protein, partial [Verrucomicrobiota bacterium]
MKSVGITYSTGADTSGVGGGTIFSGDLKQATWATGFGNTNDFTFSKVQNVKAVKIVYTSNYGGDGTGLSEVLFGTGAPDFNTSILPNATALSVAANSTLDLGGLSQHFTSLDGGGSIINNNTHNASVLTLNPASGSTTFSGVIGGGAGKLGLVKTGSGTQVLAGSNTYIGDTTVHDGALVLATGGRLRFVVTNATSNRLTGGGSVTLDGTFTIDTSAVTSATGTWSLVDVTNLTESFGASFGVSGFTSSGDGLTWTKTAPGRLWTFSKTTGDL